MANSDLPAWARYLLLGVFLLAIVPLAIYGVYTRVTSSAEMDPRIQSELLDPYAAALAKDDHKRAHEFLSSAARRRVDLAAYARFQASNRESYGVVKQLTLKSAAPTTEPGRERFFEVRVDYITDQGTQSVSYEVVEQDGRLLIEQSFLRLPPDRRTPRVL